MKTLALAALTILASCNADPIAMSDPTISPPAQPVDAETATLGAGCYWCIEAAFSRLDGVYSATPGFMGGHLPNPTYPDVCDGTTGHAEVVRIVFNPKKISYAQILDWFWKLHDPTTLNRQGNDIGSQYRSVIFYDSAAHQQAATTSKAAAAAHFNDPIVTKITQATAFYPAPRDHQDYYFSHKSKNPYCKVVIEPKLKKLNLDH